MIQVWLIDKDGYFTGDTDMVDNVESYMVTKPYTVGYIKGYWNGSDWEEGATQEEIEEWNKTNKIDICPKPTAEERITQLEADKEALAQNVYMLAEVLEALLVGGEEDGQEESITEDTAG